MLPMTLQLIETGLPVLLVVNIMDEAERIGMTIDIPLLREKLGIPVIGAATARKRGLAEIRSTIAEFDTAHRARFGYAGDLERDILKVGGMLRGQYRLDRRAIALLLLQKDEEIQELIRVREVV